MAVWQAIRTNELSFGLRLDPEFYQPKYLELEKKLLSFCKENVSSYASLSITPFEPARVNKFNYIEISDIKLDLGEVDFQSIGTNQTPDRAKFLMKGGEILVSTVRPNRSAIGLLPRNYHDYVVSSGFAPLKPVSVLFRAFLFIWFKTEFVTEWLTRYSTASMYPAVAVQDIINVPIFKPSPELLVALDKKIREIEILLEKSKKLYPEAEQELLERMEWGEVKTDHVLSYAATSKDIMADERLDPEFYQPKFERLENHLKKIGAIPLGDFCPTINRGVSPIYVESGEISIVNSQNLSATGVIAAADLEKTELSFYENDKNEKARLKQFDVLVYATGAYIGRTNCWFENTKAIAGIDCLIIKPDSRTCNPAYLALFLNSQAGLMQASCRASGSAQRHLYPNDLVKYQVFIPRDKMDKPDMAWQKKLADKIIAANDAQKVANQKLREAKGLVEKEIGKLIRR